VTAEPDVATQTTVSPHLARLERVPPRPETAAGALAASIERLRSTALALEVSGASSVHARWSPETLPTTHGPRGYGVEHVAVRGLATGLASAGMLSLLAAVVGMLAMQALPAPPRPSTTLPAQMAPGIHEDVTAGR